MKGLGWAVLATVFLLAFLGDFFSAAVVTAISLLVSGVMVVLELAERRSGT